jgi:predicted protein tyrosine phosphatase
MEASQVPYQSQDQFEKALNTAADLAAIHHGITREQVDWNEIMVMLVQRGHVPTAAPRRRRRNKSLQPTDSINAYPPLRHWTVDEARAYFARWPEFSERAGRGEAFTPLADADLITWADFCVFGSEHATEGDPLAWVKAMPAYRDARTRVPRIPRAVSEGERDVR